MTNLEQNALLNIPRFFTVYMLYLSEFTKSNFPFTNAPLIGVSSHNTC